MSKTMTVSGMMVVVESSSRNETLRSVFLSFPHVNGGLRMELTSFRNGAVEVYTFDSDGLPRYRGTVRDYYPSDVAQGWLRAAWYAEQHSKAARAAFEASASHKSYELPTAA